MKPRRQCRDCLLTQLHEYVERTLPKERAERLMARFDAITALLDPELSPPEQSVYFYELWNAETGNADPFRERKDQSTLFARDLLAKLRPLIECASDPFAARIKLAAGGNIIDYGVDSHFTLDKASAHLNNILSAPLDLAAVALLKRKMAEARSILYIADNCGEAVFDRLLIELFPEKITLGVRGKAILNDLTRREVADSGLDFVHAIVDTGDMTPGVSRERTSQEFREAMDSAELVIAKGQGNYETLDWCERPIFHLLTVKCPVVAADSGRPVGSLHLFGRNMTAD